jgi:hypothetical protein
VIKLKLLIRIIILVSFLTPFLTCHSLIGPESVSTVDSTVQSDSSANNLIDTSHAAFIDSNNLSSPERNSNDSSLLQTIRTKIFYPTDNSISGFGSIFLFPNLVGQIAIGLSFLLSFFLIFRWPFLRVKKRRLYLNILNATCMATFIIIGLLSKNVEFLWGVWLAFTLINIELIFEFKIET